MKKILKIIGIIFLVLIILVVGLYAYVMLFLPKVSPAADIKIEPTKERLERGKYLSENVCGCLGCHSARDFEYLAGPIKSGTEGIGGEVFDENTGFPGYFTSKNITPANLSSWTDGEIFRALTAGVDKNGEPLFPIMPYPALGQLSEEDINSIIAYIRTLKPIQSEIPKSRAYFPMNLIIRTMPTNPQLTKIPDKSDQVAYGKYMIKAADCIGCHTKSEKGEFLPGMEYAGGVEFKFPNGAVVTSANLTPDKETGLGSWTKEQFISRFKSFSNPQIKLTKVKTNDFNTPMPWIDYSGMTDEDIGAIFIYLQTLKPVKNPVEKFKPAQ